MRPIPRFTVQSTRMVIVLLLTAGLPRAVPDAWADAGAAETVREVAAICRQVPDGEAKPGKCDSRPEYDRVIARLDRSMFADLQAIASSSAYSTLERRLATILCRRIEHPEEFERIEPYLTPVRNEGARLSPPFRDNRPRVAVMLKPVDDPELLEPTLRDIVNRHRPLYDELHAAAARKRKQLEAIPDNDDSLDGYESMKKVLEQYGKETEEITGRYKVDTIELGRLCGTLGTLQGVADSLDRKYLPALEEAVCRVQSWEMRLALIEIVAAMRREDSAPVLLSQLPLGLKRDDKWGSVSGRILRDVFWCDPSQAITEELYRTLNDLSQSDRDKVLREVTSTISHESRWQKFLGQLRSDPQWKPKVDLLLGGPASSPATAE